MSGKPIQNYSTTVAVDKTVGEIMGMLARAGTRSLQVHYEDGAPVGVDFLIETRFGERAFRLPVKIDAVWLALAEQGRRRLIPPRFATSEQGARVAWRIARDWLENQLALIDVGMAEIEQVLLPYMLQEPGQTVYELLVERRLTLPPGKED